MPVESVYARLEPLLPLVRKPVQYVGGELNAVVKDWDAAEVRWALMYPDAYEVGIPNQGIQILYEVLNGGAGVLAERTYSVWPDMEKLLREHGIPQFTVDAHRPCGRSTCSVSASPPNWGTPTCSPHSTWPASRWTPRSAVSRTPSSWRAGTRPSTRSRSPSSPTAWCSVMVSRRYWR